LLPLGTVSSMRGEASGSGASNQRQAAQPRAAASSATSKSSIKTMRNHDVRRAMSRS
jgi:hypothetical protein